MNRIRKRPNDFLKEPYSRVIIPDAETGTYTAEIFEFPGCIAQGNTPQEALKTLESVAEAWIIAAQDMGQKIPLPFIELNYSGRFPLRMPKSLHRQAAIAAKRDNTSLNQFIVSAVAEKAGALNFYENLSHKFIEEKSSIIWKQIPTYSYPDKILQVRNIEDTATTENSEYNYQFIERTSISPEGVH